MLECICQAHASTINVMEFFFLNIKTILYNIIKRFIKKNKCINIFSLIQYTCITDDKKIILS